MKFSGPNGVYFVDQAVDSNVREKHPGLYKIFCLNGHCNRVGVGSPKTNPWCNKSFVELHLMNMAKKNGWKKVRE